MGLLLLLKSEQCRICFHCNRFLDQPQESFSQNSATIQTFDLNLTFREVQFQWKKTASIIKNEKRVRMNRKIINFRYFGKDLSVYHEIIYIPLEGETAQ